MTRVVFRFYFIFIYLSFKGIMLGQRLPPVTGGGTAHVEGVPQFTLGEGNILFRFFYLCECNSMTFENIAYQIRLRSFGIVFLFLTYVVFNVSMTRFSVEYCGAQRTRLHSLA